MTSIRDELMAGLPLRLALLSCGGDTKKTRPPPTSSSRSSRPRWRGRTTRRRGQAMGRWPGCAPHRPRTAPAHGTRRGPHRRGAPATGLAGAAAGPPGQVRGRHPQRQVRAAPQREVRAGDGGDGPGLLPPGQDRVRRLDLRHRPGHRSPSASATTSRASSRSRTRTTPGLPSFEKATQVHPALGPAWLNLGAQYLKIKNYRAAVPVLERAVQLMPNRPEAHLNLGSAYRGSGSWPRPQQLEASAQAAPELPHGLLQPGHPVSGRREVPRDGQAAAAQPATANLNKYKQQMLSTYQDDPVETYIDEAQRKIQARAEEHRAGEEAQGARGGQGQPRLRGARSRRAKTRRQGVAAMTKC